MVPTLYEYDAFGNVAKQTLALADQAAPDNSPIQKYAYGVENAEDGVYQVTAQTRYNAEGHPLTSVHKQLISELSTTLETKTVIVNERGLTAMEWTEYAGKVKKLQKSAIPTSDITAQTVTVDGFALFRSDHAGITTTATRAYTAAGMTLAQTDGRGNTTTEQTDVAGRTISVTDAANNTTTTQYDGYHDQPSMVTNALGHTSCCKYDICGRKTDEWGTAIQPAVFGYDEADRMVSLTTFRIPKEGGITEDPSRSTDGDTTVWTYHGSTGLEIKKTYADGSHIDKTYDAFNNLATGTNARGIVTTRTWETSRGMLPGISFSDDTPGQSFSYNPLGQLMQVVDASGTRAFSYNQYGELETDNLAVNGNAYQLAEHYGELGRPNGYSLAAENRSIQNTLMAYNSKGRIAWIYSEYGGLVEKLAYPNGMTRVNTYGSKRDLISVVDYQRPGTNTTR